MSFQIGDTVHNTAGKLYTIRSFWISSRSGPSATLAPLKPNQETKKTNASLESLTLVRSRELSLAYHYAADSEREEVPRFTRNQSRLLAAHWLSRAEERNDDSRAALCIGSDRILELEAAS